MYTVEHLVFGYDLESIEKVQHYVENNYEIDKDFVMYIAIGDDVMWGLDITEKMLNDEKLMYLVDQCEGQGEFVD